MKLVNYERYTKKWSPRSTVGLAVGQALITGIFLGGGLVEAASGHDVWRWVFSLALAFASGVGALLALLVALHNCVTQATPPK